MDEKNQTDEKQIQCGYCPKKTCFKGDLTKIPKFCPTNIKPEILERSKEVLKDPENLKMAQDVARTWKDYGKLTRIEETVLYAQLRGYQKIGLAFCVGLSQEAELFANILFNEGFDVVSASCSCAALSSEDIELPEEDKIFAGIRQPMCNPIGQALLMNSENVEMNVLLGLCVGDDALFIKHAEAPVSVLAVKDRVLAHNPLAALYTSRSIYTRLKTRKPKKADG